MKISLDYLTTKFFLQAFNRMLISLDIVIIVYVVKTRKFLLKLYAHSMLLYYMICGMFIVQVKQSLIYNMKYKI